MNQLNTCKKRIIILVHENTQKEQLLRSYYIVGLAGEWQNMGFEVLFLLGTQQYIPADILIMHVDLSVVPESYQVFAKQYPVVLNQHILDIRKSSFSQNLLSADTDWQGPVIVKTDLNHAGTPEFQLLGKTRSVIGQHRINQPEDYPVLAHSAEVPAICWTSSDFVVEKFIPEQIDGMFFRRNYAFLGDQETWYCVGGHSPIVHMDSVSVEKTPVAHQQIRDIRQQLNMDYGRLDYVIYQGQPVVLDVNKTPGYLAMTTQARREALQRRAQGILQYL